MMRIRMPAERRGPEPDRNSAQRRGGQRHRMFLEYTPLKDGTHDVGREQEQKQRGRIDSPSSGRATSMTRLRTGAAVS